MKAYFLGLDLPGRFACSFANIHVLQPEVTNVAFWFIPPSLRSCEENEKLFIKIGKIIPTIKNRYLTYRWRVILFVEL